MKRFLTISSLLMGTVFGSSFGSHANTIDISTSGDPKIRATLSDGTMSNTLLGFVGVQMTSSTDAYAFDTGNSGEATEIAFANTYSGQSFTTLDFSKDSSGDTSFTVDAPYFLLKVGGGGDGNLHVLFQNLSGGPLDLTYEKLSGKGFTGYGLSHVDSFGTLSSVPLPASAPMFGAALIALGAIGYGVRRKIA